MFNINTIQHGGDAMKFRVTIRGTFGIIAEYDAIGASAGQVDKDAREMFGGAFGVTVMARP